MSYNSTHVMQLPRKVTIGCGILQNCGLLIKGNYPFLKSLAIITGPNIRDSVSKSIEESMLEHGFDLEWIIAKEATFQFGDEVTTQLNKQKSALIIGLGGGRCIDLGKLVASRLKVPFISIPTSASHDGISSPFVSLKGNERPYSIMTETPTEIIGDLEIIANAPRRLLASGCGDLIAKTTAVKDWELARDFNNEYYGEYAAKLAYLGSRMIIDISNSISTIQTATQLTRTIVEGLISSGVAAGIAGSSRPCSGSEHLFSHALEYIAKRHCGLHGERVGIGTIIMSKLHGLDWQEIRESLRKIGAPVTGKAINVDKDQMIDALLLARTLRPERYTILSKNKYDKKDFEKVIVETGILD